jgi:hypothetical protein
VCPYAARRAPPLVAGRPPLNPSHLLFIQRFTYALCNDGWIVVYRKRHGALKAVRARDEHAKPAFERVSGDLCFVRSLGVLAARDNGRFDVLATLAGEPLNVEHCERHTTQL